MPGEPTLPNEHYPDYFQIVTVPFNHTLEATAAHTIPFMYVEPRASNGTGIVVDSVAIGISVVEGAAETVEVVHATTVDATSGFVSIQTAATSVNALGTTIPTINTSNNFVPANSWIMLKFSDAQANTHGCVTIRFRSRLK
jgi:hypothetical protein